MSTQRYIIHPGPVTSRTDGDRHWVTAGRLIALYRRNPKHCQIAWPDTRAPNVDRGIHLYPLYNGNYDEVADDLDGVTP